MGLRVIAIDTGADKKKLCASYGAEYVSTLFFRSKSINYADDKRENSKFIDFKDYKDPEAFIKAIKDECDGVGPHAAVVAAAGGA